MGDLGALLKFPFGTLDKFGVATSGIVVSRTTDGTPQLVDLSSRLVNANDIPGGNSLLCETINHFGSKVVDCFHVGRTQRESPRLLTLTVPVGMSINLDFHNFSFHDFLFFIDTDTHGSSNRLSEGLRLAHFQAEDFCCR